MTQILLKHLLRSAILPVLFTGTVLAQQPAASLSDLPSHVQKGDRIEVTVRDGRILKGQFETIKDSALQMQLGGRIQDISGATITGIRKQRPDSNLNGALFGLAAGAGAGVVATNMTCSANDSECTGTATLIFVPLFAVGGAGVGELIDQLIHKYDPIYRSETASGPRLRLSPLVSRDKKGVRLTMSF